MTDHCCEFNQHTNFSLTNILENVTYLIEREVMFLVFYRIALDLMPFNLQQHFQTLSYGECVSII